MHAFPGWKLSDWVTYSSENPLLAYMDIPPLLSRTMLSTVKRGSWYWDMWVGNNIDGPGVCKRNENGIGSHVGLPVQDFHAHAFYGTPAYFITSPHVSSQYHGLNSWTDRQRLPSEITARAHNCAQNYRTNRCGFRIISWRHTCRLVDWDCSQHTMSQACKVSCWPQQHSRQEMFTRSYNCRWYFCGTMRSFDKASTQDLPGVTTSPSCSRGHHELEARGNIIYSDWRGCDGMSGETDPIEKLMSGAKGWLQHCYP